MGSWFLPALNHNVKCHLPCIPNHILSPGLEVSSGADRQAGQQYDNSTRQSLLTKSVLMSLSRMKAAAAASVHLPRAVPIRCLM